MSRVAHWSHSLILNGTSQAYSYYSTLIPQKFTGTFFNHMAWSLSEISKACHYSTFNISNIANHYVITRHWGPLTGRYIQLSNLLISSCYGVSEAHFSVLLQALVALLKTPASTCPNLCSLFKNMLHCIFVQKRKAFIRRIVEAVGRLSSGVTIARQP